MKKNALFLFFICGSSCTIFLNGRSVHRPKDPLLPQITARWENDPKKYSISDCHLSEYPIFKIKAQECKKKQLPAGDISFANNTTKTVPSAVLDALIEEVVSEIKQGKRKFKSFTKIHASDFNHKKCCGLIVLKFKDYPFVVKLSFEKPDTFVNPYCKGFIPMFFFFMAEGANRHISGLTRIKNLEVVNEKIAHSRWANVVSTPRKWFWLSKNTRWFEVVGKNIGNHATIETKYPEVYGIIADAVDTKDDLLVSKRERGRMIMRLCNDLDLFIDPHSNNFVFKIDPITKKQTITIIDTEHFPTIVGIKEKHTFKSHAQWYGHLINKAIKDILFRTKKDRRKPHPMDPEIALY